MVPSVAIPYLPPELIDAILGHVDDGDQPLLLSCRLVSRTWSQLCLPLVFRTISVRLRDEGFHASSKPLQSFYEFSSTRTDISRYVQTLSILYDTPIVVQDHTILHAYPIDVDLLHRTFLCFPNLHTLSLDNVIPTRGVCPLLVASNGRPSVNNLKVTFPMLLAQPARSSGALPRILSLFEHIGALSLNHGPSVRRSSSTFSPALRNLSDSSCPVQHLTMASNLLMTTQDDLNVWWSRSLRALTITDVDLNSLHVDNINVILPKLGELRYLEILPFRYQEPIFQIEG